MYLNQKKIAGILLETTSMSNASHFDYFSIGIGINLNNSSFPHDIEQKATSLFLETKKKVSHKKVVTLLTQRIIKRFKLREEINV